MPFLPIVHRELRTASRRRTTYSARFGAALAAFVTLTLIWLAISPQTANAGLAMSALYSLGGLAFFFAFLSGIGVTSDCLSHEKREGTLGLLFLTDLHGYDVVLGKLFASSLAVTYWLMSMVPVMAIPLLLGGITFAEFVRIVGACFAMLFLSLSTGTFSSALSRSAQRSAGATLSLLIAILGAAPAAGLIIAIKGGHPFDPAFYVTSPVTSFVRAFESKFVLSEYFISISATLAWALLFLALASWIVPKTWQDKPGGTVTLRWRDRWRQWTYGAPSARRRYRHRLLALNPFFWLAARHRLKPAMVFAVLGAATACYFWFAYRFPRDAMEPSVFVFVAILMGLLMKSWAASEAVRTVFAEREAGTFELILSTPLSVTDIERGQWLACRRQFGGPILFILVAELVMFIIGLRNYSVVDRGHWLLMFITGTSHLLLDMYAICWLGMWFGLKARDANRAAARTAACIILLPILFVFLFVILMNLLGPARAWQPAKYAPELLWLFLKLAVSGFFVFWARTNIREHLRELAAHRYDPHAPSPWKFWRRAT